MQDGAVPDGFSSKFDQHEETPKRRRVLVGATRLPCLLPETQLWSEKLGNVSLLGAGLRAWTVQSKTLAEVLLLACSHAQGRLPDRHGAVHGVPESQALRPVNLRCTQAGRRVICVS